MVFLCWVWKLVIVILGTYIYGTLQCRETFSIEIFKPSLTALKTPKKTVFIPTRATYTFQYKLCAICHKNSILERAKILKVCTNKKDDSVKEAPAYCRSFLVSLRFWGHHNFWGCLHFWGRLQFWGLLHFDVVFWTYSMSRPNLLFTASKSDLKHLR